MAIRSRDLEDCDTKQVHALLKAGAVEMDTAEADQVPVYLPHLTLAEQVLLRKISEDDLDAWNDYCRDVSELYYD